MEQIINSQHNVNVFGAGDQVMFLVHGYGCNQSMWRYVIPEFEGQYKVVVNDLIGCGKSDASLYDFEKYSSLEGYADDIIKICEANEFKDIILVGHSVSAITAMLVANKKPELVDKLIMVVPSPRYINENGYNGGFEKEDIDELVESLDSNYLGWSSTIAPVIVGRPNKPEISQELNDSFCANDPEIAKHFAKVTFLGDNREDLSKVKHETLIIMCNSDVIAPHHVGEYVQSQIKNSKLVVLNTSGHCPHLSAPEETVQAIKDFL